MDFPHNGTSSLSSLVQALCVHFMPTAATAGGVSASQHFDVAVITAGHLLGGGGSSTERRRHPSAALQPQMEMLLAELELVVSAEGSTCGSSASLSTLTALILLTLRALEEEGSEADAQRVLDAATRWETCLLRLLKSSPAFPDEVQRAACFCAAQLIVRGGRPWHLGSSLLKDACAAISHYRGRWTDQGNGDNGPLRPISGDGAGVAAVSLSLSAAVELISQCASMLIACHPPTLRAESIDPSVMGLGTTTAAAETQSGGDRKGAAKSGGGGSDGVARRKDEGGKRTARRAGKEDSPGAKPPTTTGPADDQAALPLPAPSREAVSALRGQLIDCCLNALSSGGDEIGNRRGDAEGAGGGGSGSNSSNSKATGGDVDDDAALLCRRILIPLLLMDEDDDDDSSSREDVGLATYKGRIEALLRSLGGTRGNTAADCKRRSEAIVIVAALFDFLFRVPTSGAAATPSTRGGIAGDFRSSDFLWSLLVGSFWDALTCTELDAGRRASMQLRSEYLLKRIVDLCRGEPDAGAAATVATTTTVFHECFSWTPRPPPSSRLATELEGREQGRGGRGKRRGGSESSWELFFLVLETLNEFGLHIVVPAMAKLDSLASKLQEQLEHDAQGNGALPACWVELLFLKLVLHPNLGVRKVGLRRLWSLPLSVLGTFSERFLYGFAFLSASDPRLCSDLDRTPISPSFLEAKSALTTTGSGGALPFEVAEERTVPLLEPLAQSIEEFYAQLFRVHLRSGAERTAAMLLLLDAVGAKPAKFTTATFARLLLHLAKTLYWEHACGVSAESEPSASRDGLAASPHGGDGGGGARTKEMALNPTVLQRLATLLRDTMQDNMDLCLDVRIVAIIFEALLHYAAVSPRDFREHEAFWQLLCMCGPLGQSGGARLDACGAYGTVGASVDPHLLNLKLVSLSRELQPAGTATSAGCSNWLVHELLQPQTLALRTEDLLREAGRAGDRNGFSEVKLKSHFFLLGALQLTGCPEDQACVEAVAHHVAQTVVSYRNRVYASEDGLLAALAAFVEVSRSTNGGYGTATDIKDSHGAGAECQPPPPRRFLFPMPVLAEVSDTIFTRAKVSLEAGLAATTTTTGTADDHLDSTVWHLLHTALWDVLAAAAMWTHQMAAQQDRDGGAASTQAQEQVVWLVEFLGRCADSFCQISDAGRREREEQGGTRVYASLVVARDASRLLQSVLCGLVYCPPTPSANPRTRRSAAAGSDEGEGTEQIGQESGHVGCFLNTMDAAAAAEAIAALTRAVPQRMSAAAAHTSSLSSQSSSSATLAEHFRFVYNSIFILCQRVTDTANRARTCRLLEEFGLTHVEECWTNNLACVYDILSWVVMAASQDAPTTTTIPPTVDRESILTAMLSHLQDASAKQHVRVSLIAYYTLQHVFTSNPDFVVQSLIGALDDEAESDRVTYIVAITASLLVLRDPVANWPVLKDVLVRVAVLHNANRDGEENESSLAATEPLLASWPDALRILYPPTVRMAAVGRALALSTILHCCSLDVAATGGVALVQPFCLELLEMNGSDPVVTREPCMPNSRTHRVRIRLWQLLVLLLPFLPRELAHTSALFDALVRYCIPTINMGSVRRFIEIFTIELLARQPSLYHALADALAVRDLRPQVCGTYVLAACHTLLRQERESAADTEESASSLTGRLYPLVLQQATSHQHLLRIISHIGIYRLCATRRARGKAISRDTAALFAYLADAPEHVKFREKYDAALFYDTSEAASPRSVLCVMRREANAVLRESLPAAAFERMRFVETETCCLTGAQYPAERLRAHMIGATYRTDEAGEPPVLQNATQALSIFADAPYIPHTARRAQYYVDYTVEAAQVLTSDTQAEVGGAGGGAAVHEGSGDATDNIQKKITPWWGSEVYNELHPRALHSLSPGSVDGGGGGGVATNGTGHRRQQIIVVGSLLLNPVNIAGLCRCGEIFAVEQIVIPEKKVFEHPHFVATARSAELWIPWAEVAPRDLPGYLEGKRRDGYTICGIEQTAGSVSMADYAFPDKVVVVLGSEGQGIPAPLLPMLDVCVEIPQYGLIRSLNVHVTGSLVMYEYTKQHLMGRDAQ